MPQDVPRLIEKMGGDEKFVARLDEMFDSKEAIVNFSEDVVGLIGMYAHGNEPCHHYAYLYAYAGQPWKTQARIRQVCGTLYNNTNAGMCGNDDCGQMSAWYVFSALGFYPADPCGGVYVLGSPLVDRATIKLAPPTTRVASSRSSPGTTLRRTCISSRRLSTASRSRAPGSRMTRSQPAARWCCRWGGAQPGVGGWPGGPAEIGATWLCRTGGSGSGGAELAKG